MGVLARTLGVSVPYISDVEHGRRAPLSRERIEQVAAFLEIDPTDLLLAAARHRGSVELEANSDHRRNTAAALARGWAQFDGNDLDELDRCVAGILSKKAKQEK